MDLFLTYLITSIDYYCCLFPQKEKQKKPKLWGNIYQNHLKWTQETHLFFPSDTADKNIYWIKKVVLTKLHKGEGVQCSFEDVFEKRFSRSLKHDFLLLQATTNNHCSVILYYNAYQRCIHFCKSLWVKRKCFWKILKKWCYRFSELWYGSFTEYCKYL